MERMRDTYHSFSRRAVLLGALNASLFGLLVGRMGYLQLFQSDKYQILADRNRINLKLIKPERGKILDRHGVPIAINRQNFSLFVIPEQVKDMGKMLEKITPLADLKPHHIKVALEQKSKQPRFVPVMVKESLTWDQMAAIEVNLPYLSGVVVEENSRRHYPKKDVAAHVIGYVGAVNQAEYDKNDPVMALPGFQLGKTGLEKYYQDSLRGEASRIEEEINALGRKVRDIGEYEGKPGDDLVLTLDDRLQSYAFNQVLQHKSGAAVAMDIITGDVYSCVSAPAYDPNDFTEGLSAEKWEELLSNPAVPLVDKAIAGQYPPGSTFKMITALAALENGIINRNHKEFCPGHMDLGDHRFHCWKKEGHGQVDCRQALAQSCDVFFYQISQKLGINKIAEMAEKLGLGHQLDLDIFGERSGLMPDEAWKRKNKGQDWRVGDTILSSIGQGLILATPLQLAVMTARLANGGKLVKPHLKKPENDQIEWPDLKINQKNLDFVLSGMYDVVNHLKGTARGSRLRGKYKMAGKTGTAQVRRISMEERRQGLDVKTLPWKYRHHALFVGYAPVENPRYAVSVVIEHGVSGSGTAAPVARNIMEKLLELNPAGI